MNQYRTSQLQVFAAALLWSTGGLLIRLIQADEWTTIFWRSLFAIVFLVTVSFISNRGEVFYRFRQLGWAGLLVSILFAVDTVLFVTALNRTSIANALIMLATAPFWAALLAWIVLREPVPARTWIAMGTAIVGIVVMVSGSLGSISLTGDLMALLIAILFAVPVVTIRKYPNIPMMLAVILAAVWAMLLAAPFATFANPPSDFFLMAIFGIVEYGIALVLFTTGARFVPAAQAMLICLLEPVLGPIWVWWIIGEQPAARTLLGGGIVLFALLTYAIVDFYKSKKVSSTH